MKTTIARSVPVFVRQRRWWLLLLATWIGVMTLSFVAHVDDVREQTTHVAIEGARNMFRMVRLTRTWNANHGGVYVPVTPTTQPNPYLEHPKREITTTDGMVLTLINPAFMTRLIADIAKDNTGAVFHLTSTKPIRPGNAPDDFERRSLEAFEKGVRETMAVEDGPHGRQLRYMAPLVVEEPCLKCHAKQGYKLGDIRGGISVSQRYDPIEEATHSALWASSLSYGAVLLLVAAVGWLLLETLRRRWLDLAGKIHELGQAHSQLLQSEKMASIGQLAAGVAHEINNPIGFVTSNLGTLKRYTDNLLDVVEGCRAGTATEKDFQAIDFDYLKEDVASLMDESREGLRRVREIVANLRSFSHMGDTTIRADADLNAGIESTLSVAWNELKYKADVVRDYGRLPPVPCAAAQINQVVLNLLINAVQAIAEHGTITIRTGHDDRWAWIEIADTGAGMPPEVVARIFEPFYSTKPVGKGTGLGLSISYDIVEKHGGRIEVASTPGKGTTFRVLLPLRARAAD